MAWRDYINSNSEATPQPTTGWRKYINTPQPQETLPINTKEIKMPTTSTNTIQKTRDLLFNPKPIKKLETFEQSLLTNLSKKQNLNEFEQNVYNSLLQKQNENEAENNKRLQLKEPTLEANLKTSLEGKSELNPAEQKVLGEIQTKSDINEQGLSDYLINQKVENSNYDKLDDTSKRALAFGGGVLEGINPLSTLDEITDYRRTGGETSKLLKKLTEKPMTEYPVASTIGSVVGALIPAYIQYGGANAIIGEIPAVQGLFTGIKNPIVQSIVKKVAIDAIGNTAISTPQVIAKGVTDNKSGVDILKDVLIDEGINAGFATVFAGFEDRKAITQAISELKAGQITQEQLENVVEQEAKAALNETQSKGVQAPTSPLKAEGEELPSELKYASADADMDATISSKIQSNAKEISDGLQTSKLYENTIMKSNIFTDEQKALFKKEDFQYDTKSETESLNEAADRLIKNYAGEQENIASKEFFGGSDTDVAMLIAKDIAESGDNAKLVNYFKDLRPKFTEQGRGIQALKKWSNTAEGALFTAVKESDHAIDTLKKVNPNKIKKAEADTEKLLELFRKKGQAITQKEISQVSPKAAKTIFEKIDLFYKSGAFQDEVARPYIEKALGIPTLTGQDADNIVNLMKINADETLSAKQRQDALNEVYSIIANLSPTTLSDYLQSWRHTAMLLNLPTHARNFFGNAVFMALRKVKDPVAQVFEITLRKENRTKAVGWFLDRDLVGTVKQYSKDYLPQIMESGKFSNIGALQRYKKIWTNGAKFKDVNKLNPVNWAKFGIQKTVDANYKMLDLGDIPYSKNAFESSLGQRLKAKGLKEPTKEMLDKATADAVDAVFRSDNALVRWLIQGKKLPGGQILDAIIPFVKTPINLGKKSFEYSPLGMFNVIAQIRNAIKGTKAPSDVIDAIAKTLTGSALVGFGAWLRANGFITGAPSKDKDQAAFDLARGIQPYSVKIGDNYYSYDWISPVGSLLASGAVMFQSTEGNIDLSNAFMDISAAGLDSLANATVFKGVKDAFGGYNEGVSGTAQNIGEDYINSLIPAIIGKSGNLLKDKQYTTYYEQNPFIKNLQNKAGITEGLQPKIDIKGQEIGTGNILERIGSNFLSPSKISTEKSTPIDNEISRIYKSTGNKDVFPRVTPKSLISNKQTYVLTPEEATKFQTIQGQETYKRLEALFKSQAYIKATDEQKAKLIKNITDIAYNTAKIELIKERKK